MRSPLSGSSASVFWSPRYSSSLSSSCTWRVNVGVSMDSIDEEYTPMADSMRRPLGGLLPASTVTLVPESATSAVAHLLRSPRRDPVRQNGFPATNQRDHLVGGHQVDSVRKSLLGGRAYVAAASASLGDMATARAAMAEFKRLQPDYSISTFRAELHGNNADFLRQRERLYLNLRKAGLAA